eukprot:scaffold19238_cov121-Isochrysis_galbana.AAC.6
MTPEDREPTGADAPDMSHTESHTPLHGPIGGVPSDKALSDIPFPFSLLVPIPTHPVSLFRPHKGGDGHMAARATTSEGWFEKA